MNNLLFRPVAKRLAVPAAIALMFSVAVGGCATSQQQHDAAEMRQDPQPLADGWPTACSVHGTRLREDIVPIVYGLPGELDSREQLEAMRSRFPNAATYYLGGCVTWWGQPRRAHVMFCPECRAARKAFYEAAAAPAHARDQAPITNGLRG